jgi:hypothetical protein
VGPPDSEQGFTCPALLGIPLGSLGFRIRGFHPLWPDFPDRSAILSRMPCRGPATPSRKRDGLGCSAFARHYLRNHCCFLFLRVLRCFTSPGVALKPYVFRLQYPAITRDGLPHSEIPGSKRVCRSPRLIAAYHVLHRLLMPRHPSCALIRLTKKSSASHISSIPARFSLEKLQLLALSMQLSKNKPFRADGTANRPPRKRTEVDLNPASRSAPPGGRAWNRTRDLVLIRDAL